MKLHYIKQYDALVKTLLFGKSSYRPDLYITSEGVASIGFNFNLQDEHVLSRVLEVLKFDIQGKTLSGEALVAERYYVGMLRSAFFHCNGSDLMSLLIVVQNILAARRADNRYQHYSQFQRVAEFSLPGKEKALALCYSIMKHHEKTVDDWLTAFGFDILKVNSHLLSRNSKERAVLVSLASQRVIDVDPYGKPVNFPLANAFIDNDRAEIWYQIRYGSFDNALPEKNIVKRRYFESELFGLYDDGVRSDNINREQCKRIYAMYNTHKEHILHFERNFKYLVAEANTELKLMPNQQIKTLEQSFSIAYNHIRTVPYATTPINRFVAQMEDGMEDLLDFWSQNDDLDYEIALAS